MHKRKLIVACVILLLTVGTSGCALISTAVSAGIAYGIYQVSKR